MNNALSSFDAFCFSGSSTGSKRGLASDEAPRKAAPKGAVKNEPIQVKEEAVAEAEKEEKQHQQEQQQEEEDARTLRARRRSSSVHQRLKEQQKATPASAKACKADAEEKSRETRDAPVDSMGVEAQTGKDEKERRFAVLLAVMLSSQTKDEQTNACMQRLRQEDLLSPQAIADCDIEHLRSLLYGVGFHNNKTVFIKAAAETLLKEYEGEVPRTLEGLMRLKGVGRKMANIVMHCGVFFSLEFAYLPVAGAATQAWNAFEGIAVDVHVHRISNRLGWVKTKTPEETEIALEDCLPRHVAPLLEADGEAASPSVSLSVTPQRDMRQHWEDVNLLLVGFGQQICKPVNPACATCLARLHCPIGRKRLEKLTLTPHGLVRRQFPIVAMQQELLQQGCCRRAYPRNAEELLVGVQSNVSQGVYPTLQQQQHRDATTARDSGREGGRGTLDVRQRVTTPIKAKQELHLY
ncbi:endonuclease III-like protein [Cyclospora cayetanensis]|uniref:DNA-(apurinic or apyrimidinic site) lyase n=1 Tax=Cyclospora cayetanensis TaxID=88456 RepID=A0A1D3DAL1_9EIME|nr:endonuclease III-like protein [Cyclospora cayetanensis]